MRPSANCCEIGSNWAALKLTSTSAAARRTSGSSCASAATRSGAAASCVGTDLLQSQDGFEHHFRVVQLEGGLERGNGLRMAGDLPKRQGGLDAIQRVFVLQGLFQHRDGRRRAQADPSERPGGQAAESRQGSVVDVLLRQIDLGDDRGDRRLGFELGVEADASQGVDRKAADLPGGRLECLNQQRDRLLGAGSQLAQRLRGAAALFLVRVGVLSQMLGQQILPVAQRLTGVRGHGPATPIPPPICAWADAAPRPSAASSAAGPASDLRHEFKAWLTSAEARLLRRSRASLGAAADHPTPWRPAARGA